MKYTNIGEKWLEEENENESGRIYTKKMIENAVDNMELKPIINGERLPMGPGMAINRIMQEMRGKHTHYGISNELAPYGFYLIVSKFKDLTNWAYYIDTGTECFCICHHEIGAQAEAQEAKQEALI